MTLRVLIVEDDPQRAEILKLGLRQPDCEVAGYVNVGADLLARVLRMEPDVIIMDRQSADADTLEHIGNVTRYQPRPIVLFTPDEDRGKIRKAVDAGVSAYVVGGLTPERVRPIVDAAVARFETLQALRDELDHVKRYVFSYQP